LRRAQALAEGEANRGAVRVDPLQRLHTLANLAELLGAAGAGVPGAPRTLRDSQLLAEADGIREARPGPSPAGIVAPCCACCA